MKNLNLLRKTLFLVAFSLLVTTLSAQTYRPIKGWSQEINDRLESFLNSTITITERKVAAFDCDGTLFGQVPYYLADEALYDHAKRTYEGKKDAKSKEKMQVVDQLLHGDNVGLEYVQNRARYLSGMTADEIRKLGKDMFKEKYQTKFYPEMKELLANLKEYGFEIWVITASPEVLYEQFVAEELGIPNDRILGIRTVTTVDGISTDKLVHPVSQDGGKAEVIHTMIKARPLLVGGNSRGDMEMMNESAGIKLMVNPDNKKVEGKSGGLMEGSTAKQYWEKDPNAVIVYCNDVPENDYRNINKKYTYVTEEYGVKSNAVNKK